MLVYYIVLIYWFVLLSRKRSQTNNSDLFWAVLPLFLIMALKSVSVGCDTISYYHRYINADDLLTSQYTITEQGYNKFSYFFHDILGVPFYVYYSVYSAIICCILALFLKHFSANIYLSLFVYMTIGLFSVSLSGMRQLLAISICMIPVIWAKICEDKGNEKLIHKLWRLIISVLFVLLAQSFHNSSIIFLPILFMLDIRLSKQQTIIIMFLAIASIRFKGTIANFMSFFVTEKYEKYDLSEGYNMNILMLLVPIAIGLFCVFASQPEEGKHKYSKSISTMYIFLSLVVLFNNLALNHIQLSRLGFYFMNSYIILIPYILKRLTSDSRSVITLSVLLLCFIFFYLGTNGGTLRIDHYKFFWQEPEYFKNW